MRYRSTRGQSTNLSFEEAVFEGLATDGGLYIPHSIPTVPLPEILSWSTLSFPQLAAKIFRKFIAEDEIPTPDLEELLARSFATFSTPEVTPLKKLPNVLSGNENRNLDNIYVLELFHGPTFAFKDVALQVLGNLFEYFLQRKNKNGGQYAITVVGATSGDTGGAAIYGLRGKKNVDVFILHPKGRISPVQEQQMTSVLDENVHNVAIEGTFDDCQDIVKALFSDEPFRRRFHLAAINSINWARILAQTSYYFYSYFSLLKRLGILPTASTYANITKVQYSVPTGNFGDILAGYYAVRMGLPIDRLVVATNENDILHRFFETGSYEKRKSEGQDEAVRMTLSPAMDILVSSNFERLIWYLVRGDSRTPPENGETEENAQLASKTIDRWMAELKTSGGFSVSGDVLGRAKQIFSSFCTTDAQTSDAIRRYYHNQYNLMQQRDANGDKDAESTAYVLDPHTAVGVVAAENFVQQQPLSTAIHTICLSTASPGKFPDAVLKAINENPPLESVQMGFKPVSYKDIAPKELVELEGKPKRCIEIGTDGGKKEVGLEKVRRTLEQEVGVKFPSKI
ncbi:threonine synthase [Gaertneriomyces semiglobifer]|nr:threonine synthase [Gaertneriomyces semiglobifer]